MQKTILTALLSTSLIATAIPASSEGVFLNSLLDNYEFHDNDPDFWTHQGQRAQTIVENAKYLGVTAAEKLHYKLGLDEKGPKARAGYAAIASLLEFQFQTANAIFFGHEYAHFQTRDYFGFPDHYFYNTETAEEVDGLDLYVKLLFGSNPATAMNVGAYNGKDPGKTILTKSAGLNWQMNYSEEWVRRGLRSGGNRFFASAGYLNNRAKMFGYAMSDEDGDPGNLVGDVEFISHHFQNNLGIDTSISDIRMYSGLSLLASPTTWSVVQGFSDYAMTGDLKMKDPFFEAGPVPFTWDIPSYLNAENMTLAPTAYFDIDGYVVGAGIETPVIGEGDDEYTLSIGKNWDSFFVEAEHTFAPDGGHTEIEAGYDFNDHFGVEVRHMTSSGQSYRGDRNNLYGEDVTFAGINVRF
ncbi:hypothetical protein [Salipiger mucosus]|uniref:Porin n=1 Tax=Salipiger mucosus DSM 16094 TaxID=1123237 RepID=S9Q5X2_9RHOB|nr:hypothetical protein [Salipiger mucosus]EPX76781.1 hypothetical protein Salmuc_04667 [Salipiger mucosus DSM 16094]